MLSVLSHTPCSHIHTGVSVQYGCCREIELMYQCVSKDKDTVYTTILDQGRDQQQGQTTYDLFKEQEEHKELHEINKQLLHEFRV